MSSNRRRSGRTKKRGPRRRSRSVARIRRPLALKPHAFVERLSSDTMTVNTEASASGLFKSFSLDQISQVASYKALFEYYTINKIVVEFRYKSTGGVANLDQTVANRFPFNEINPVLYFKTDHNDITADTLATMKKSMKTHEHQLSNDKPNFTIQIKPAVQAEAYKSSISTTYIPKWGQQLSVNDGTVPHYGLKAYAIGVSDSAVSPGQIEVTYKMYFTMKNNE